MKNEEVINNPPQPSLSTKGGCDRSVETSGWIILLCRGGFIVAMLFNTLLLHAQQTINDDRLRQLHDSLPKGWEMEAALTPFDADTDPQLFLFISRTEEVKVLQVNKINMDATSANSLDKRAQKEGKPQQLELKLRMEPKWSKERFDKVLAYDDSLDALKKVAFDTYKIAELQKPHPLGKGQFDYDDNTPEKKKRLKAYNEECDRLNKQKQPWPNYSSSTYSLFFYYDYGKWQHQQVYPPQAEAEEFSIVKLIESILKSDYAY